MSDDSLDIELATSAVLADNDDVRLLLRMLANQLSSSLGERVRIEREGNFFKKSDQVRSLRVTLGPTEYAAEYRRGAVEATIGHNSGGIRIRSEKVGMDQWVRSLLADLQQEAATNLDSKTALENIVLGGGRL